jgi:hypothetical protein
MPNFVAGFAMLLLACMALSMCSSEAKAADGDRFFEMRTYYAAPGKLDAMHARFRDHTNKLFVKHGMQLVGYWVPAEGNGTTNTMVYILAYANKEARDKAWKDFAADPDWVKAKAASEVDGKLVEKVDILFLKPTDYSPIK